VGLLVGLAAVALGALAFAASSVAFLWSREHAGPSVRATGKGASHFFELEDEGATSLEADLDVALGSVHVGRAEAGALFQAEVTLAHEGLRPRFEGTTGAGRAHVALGLGGEAVSLGGVRATHGNAWRLYFSERVPLALDLALGAAEADLDFTGIPLSRLDLDCGMAHATLRFGAPNPVPMERLLIETGLSDFAARGLGHARFQALFFDGGAGEFTLDFTGDALRPGATASVDVGMASLTLVLPAGHPVVLDAPTSFMTHVEVPAAMTRTAKGRWATPGADADPAALHLDVDAGPGNVLVRLAE
jgi:hypothetical protein